MSDKTIITVDSTQIAHYLDCPQLWDYSDRQRLEPYVISAAGELVQIKEPSQAIAIGTYGHKLMEIYYKAKACGGSSSKALDEALAFDPLVGMQSTLDKPTIKSVQERFRLYTYTYLNNDIAPLDSDAVEIGFSHPIYESDSRLYILEGRIDLLGTINGTQCLMDHKFQERHHDLYKKSVQFRNYALVSRRNLLIINYIRFAKEINKDTFKREVVSFSTPELEVWKQRLIRVFDNIEKSLKYNEFEQHWSACTGRYNSICKYTPLCEEWNQEIIDVKIRTQYWQREEWKPW